MSNKIYCSMCGAISEEGDLYCPSCGEKLETPVENSVKPPKKRTTRKRGIVIISIVVVLALIAGGVAFLGAFDTTKPAKKKLGYDAEGNLQNYYICESVWGKEKKWIQYDLDGKKTGAYTLVEYLDGGDRKKIYYDKDGATGNYLIWHYDKNGQAIGWSCYINGDLNYNSELISDNGDERKIRLVDKDGNSLGDYLIISFDDDGNIIRTTGYDADGDGTGYTVYEY